MQKWSSSKPSAGWLSSVRCHDDLATWIRNGIHGTEQGFGFFSWVVWPRTNNLALCQRMALVGPGSVRCLVDVLGLSAVDVTKVITSHVDVRSGAVAKH